MIDMKMLKVYFKAMIEMLTWFQSHFCVET